MERIIIIGKIKSWSKDKKFCYSNLIKEMFDMERAIIKVKTQILDSQIGVEAK